MAEIPGQYILAALLDQDAPIYFKELPSAVSHALCLYRMIQSAVGTDLIGVVLQRKYIVPHRDFDFLKDTCMRYSSIGIFIENVVPKLRDTPWVADQYMSFYQCHPFMEQLLKIGWFTLSKELFEDTRESIKKEYINGR